MEATTLKEPVLVKYSYPGAPAAYKCSRCSAQNCKLWREYETSPIKLMCARCAADGQDKSIDDIDFDGQRTATHIKEYRTAEIGWLVPAVPVENQPDVYWGYGGIPRKGWIWWQRLTTLPAISTSPPE